MHYPLCSKKECPLQSYTGLVRAFKKTIKIEEKGNNKSNPEVTPNQKESSSPSSINKIY
jgi:hypothetical protein